MALTPACAPVRVLIVDDAVVVRRMVSDALKVAPGIEVAGTAANGHIALQKIPQLSPDVVTLDIEMPELNGIETLRRIRARYPRLPVIMFSSLTERGAAVTLEALSAGASDYITKPVNTGSVAVAQQRIRDDLVPRILALARGREASPPGTQATPPPRPMLAPRERDAVECRRATQGLGSGVVAIGVSTGGPNALAALIPALPAQLGVPVLIVQHMPPMFTRLLAERLNAQSSLEVREAKDGDVLRAGTVTVAPGDYHMVVSRRGSDVVVRLNQDMPENSCRPAVDPLFRSVAAVYGQSALAVVLTGMGHDGMRGAEDVHRVGGHILVQDEATSVVWGMPGFIARAGLADAIVPLPQMARAIEQQLAGALHGLRTPVGALVR